MRVIEEKSTECVVLKNRLKRVAYAVRAPGLSTDDAITLGYVFHTERVQDEDVFRGLLAFGHLVQQLRTDLDWFASATVDHNGMHGAGWWYLNPRRDRWERRWLLSGYVFTPFDPNSDLPGVSAVVTRARSTKAAVPA